MRIFGTDLDRIAYLLESDAALWSEGEAKDRPAYRTNYVGSKQKLLDWIWKNTPDDIGSVADAFSGSAAVAYMFKTKGLRVSANDWLLYAYHTARAIVENSHATVSADEAEDLLKARNPKKIARGYAGKYFADEGIHELIDIIRTNIEGMSGFKRDIALSALGRTAITARGHFGHFHSGTPSEDYTAGKFRDTFLRNVERLNGLVIDGPDGCKASRKDASEFLSGIKVDLAYVDPPYATEFASTNYGRLYGFIEHMMAYGENSPAVDEATTKGNSKELFDGFLSASKHIRHLMISYRDKAHPGIKDIEDMASAAGRTVSLKSREVKYHIRRQDGSEANEAVENMFVCVKANSSNRAAAAAAGDQGSLHTSMAVEISLMPDRPGAQADVEGVPMPVTGPMGDPTFTFVLCHEGTNRNGDHFTAEELQERHQTAINKKVNLQHEQDITDIVGGIIAADYMDDNLGRRIVCVGELYVQESEPARLAYKLMKRGILAQVSMECLYEEGECSICGKRVKDKKDYCVHLRKYKGGEYDGKPVFEILRGVTFDGVALLDRKGADENARITQVAAKNGSCIEGQKHGEPGDSPQSPQEDSKMPPEPKSDENKQQEAEAAKKSLEDKDKRIADLEKENEELRQENLTLKKRIEEIEAAQKAAEQRSRAEVLVSKVSKHGLLKTDEERNAEVQRIAAMDDPLFEATAAAYDRAIAAIPNPGENQQEPNGKNSAAASSGQNPSRATGDHQRPRDMDDPKPKSLQDQLSEVFKDAME